MRRKPNTLNFESLSCLWFVSVQISGGFRFADPLDSVKRAVRVQTRRPDNLHRAVVRLWFLRLCLPRWLRRVLVCSLEVPASFARLCLLPQVCRRTPIYFDRFGVLDQWLDPNGWIPPWIVMDDSVSSSEVKSCSASLQADQKIGTSPLWNISTGLARSLVSPRSSTNDSCSLFSSSAIQIKHAGELREHEDLSFLCRQFSEHVHKVFQLGAFFDIFCCWQFD